MRSDKFRDRLDCQMGDLLDSKCDDCLIQRLGWTLRRQLRDRFIGGGVLWREDQVGKQLKRDVYAIR